MAVNNKKNEKADGLSLIDDPTYINPDMIKVTFELVQIHLKTK